MPGAGGGRADAPRKLSALTSKPVLYVANVDEGVDEVPRRSPSTRARVGAVAVAISARVESELGELGDAEAAEMRRELGIAESGLERLVHAAFDLLELIIFFTADTGKEAMARACRRGSTAWEAAGEVHTEIQQAFVRAEVISWEDLVEAGGYAGARDRGPAAHRGPRLRGRRRRRRPHQGLSAPRAGSSSSAPSFETVTWIAPGSTA